MYVGGLTAEQKSKALNCATPEEMLVLVREGGYDLSDEQLSVVSHSANDSWSECNQDTNSGPY